MFTQEQKKILWGCVLAYTAAYVARLNLSAVLPALAQEYALTAAESGLFQTVFAVVYAAGQLLNGAIADRVQPMRHMTLGLVFSALCNLLIGLSHSFGLSLVLWGINGLAQSMLWTPIVRLVALYFKDGARERASFALSFTLVAGHFIAWLVALLMERLFSFRFSFLVPACTVLLCVAPVRFLLPKKTPDISVRAAEKRSGSIRTMLKMGFLWLLLLGAANGFARDGVMAWGPSILSVGGQGKISASLLIPLLNLLGLIFGRVVYRAMGGRGRAYCALLFALCGGLCLLLPVLPNGLATALLLGMVCALMYGVNPIVTTMFPLEYDKLGMVGLAAGMLDCAIYLGSAMTGVLGGAVQGAAGLGGLYISWALAAAMGAVCCVMSMRRLSRFERADAKRG